MERLTYRHVEQNYNPTDLISPSLKWCYKNREEWLEEVVKRLATIEDILGDNYDLDELRELVEAHKIGRCVVFPCQPSDVTVYQLRNKKHALGVGVHPRHVSCATVWKDGHYQLDHQGYEPCRDRDFGKTWFLTEKEAVTALREV